MEIARGSKPCGLMPLREGLHATRERSLRCNGVLRSVRKRENVVARWTLAKREQTGVAARGAPASPANRPEYDRGP